MAPVRPAHHATCSSPGHVTHSSWRWRDTATVCVWQWPGCQARADQTVPRSAVRVACSDHRCAAANHTVSYCAVLCPCCVVLYRTEPVLCRTVLRQNIRLVWCRANYKTYSTDNNYPERPGIARRRQGKLRRRSVKASRTRKTTKGHGGIHGSPSKKPRR